MWENNVPAMQVALAGHDDILRGATEQHGSYIFKTVGDAFCCAFLTASETLDLGGGTAMTLEEAISYALEE